MDARKIVAAVAGTLLLGVVGCGQGYSPSPSDSAPGVVGGGNVFGSNPDGTVYHTASYEVLSYTLSNTMGLGTTLPFTAAQITTICGTGVASNACPKADPVGFLAANKGTLGAPVYNVDDPLSTQAPSQMTSAGFKTWALASTSACGRMMTEQATPALFPNGVNDYNYMYMALLGRAPTKADVDALNGLVASYTAAHAKCTTSGASGCDSFAAGSLTQLQGAAACSAVLNSLEFLTVN